MSSEKKKNDSLPFPQITSWAEDHFELRAMGTERFHVMNKDEVTSAPRLQVAHNIVEETNMSIFSMKQNEVHAGQSY